MADKCPLCGPLTEDDLDMKKVNKVFRETPNEDICGECWHHIVKILGGGDDAIDVLYSLVPWHLRLWYRIEGVGHRVFRMRGYRE